MEKKTQQDEIDLMNLLLKGINIIRANFWLIISFFLLGTVLGVAYYSTATKVFESKIVLSSDILIKSFTEKLFDNTKLHLRERNKKIIAAQFNISEKTAGDIALIKIESVGESTDPKEQERFIITAEVYNPEILPDLQQGLIYFLENNEFVKIRVEQKKHYLQQTISKIEQEIKDLEDFKIKIYKGDFFQNLDGNLMFDPTTVNSKILELTKEKLTLQNDLEIVNSVQVIEGFNKFERPTKPKLSLSVASGALIGLLFVGFIIGFKSIRKLLRMADAVKKPA